MVLTLVKTKQGYLIQKESKVNYHKVDINSTYCVQSFSELVETLDMLTTERD
jgi:hypothetical protein